MQINYRKKLLRQFCLSVTLLATPFLLIPVLSQPVLASTDTLADYRKTLSKIVSSINNRSPVLFNQAIDVDNIVKKSLADLAFPLSFRKNFSIGLKRGLGKIGEQFLGYMPAGHKIKVLRVKQGEHAVLALLRLDYGDSGWGYMDLWLAKEKNGKVRIIDWYDFTSGQLYTKNLQQLAVLSSPMPTNFGKVFDLVTGRKENQKALSRFILASKRQPKKSHGIFKKLDSSLRKNRIVSIIAIRNANLSGNETYYKEALANLAKHHGNDPTLALLLIDHYYLTKKYDMAIRALDSFESALGINDAAIDGLKANTYLMAGDNTRAIKHAAIGVRTEPDLENNYWTLFSVYAITKKHTQAVKIGKQLERRFNYNLGRSALIKDKDFHALLKSTAYRNWQGSK